MAEPRLLKQSDPSSPLQFYRTEEPFPSSNPLPREFFGRNTRRFFFPPIYPATVGACPVLGGIINARQVGTPQQRGLSTVLRPWHYYLFIASLCCLYCCCGSRPYGKCWPGLSFSLPLSLCLSSLALLSPLRSRGARSRIHNYRTFFADGRNQGRYTGIFFFH